MLSHTRTHHHSAIFSILNSLIRHHTFTRSHPDTLLILLHRYYSTHPPRFPTASPLSMGKSDEKQTKKRAHKAKATDGKSKHKNKPSFDSHGSSPFEITFEAIDNDG